MPPVTPILYSFLKVF